MHPARRLVTIIVGLVFLALHTCLASPASPLPLTARNIESLPTSPPPKSVWHTHDATLYGSSPDDVSLEKRAYRIYEFTAFPNENEDSWEIELDNRMDKIGQHGSDAPKIGQKEIVGTIEKTKPIEVFAERSSRTVFAGTWQRSGTCEAIPAAIKLAKDPSVYYGAQVVSRIYHPNVVRVYQWARMEGFGGRAIAAYELLGDTAKKVWLSGKLDKKKFFEEAMLGILAGVEKDIFHMDIKLDNFLRNTTDDSPYYLWKVNDWDIFEKGKPEDERSDLEGNAGTFAPEMIAKELKKSKEKWKIGPSQVFTMAMMVFKLQTPEYLKTPTPEMRTFLHEHDKLFWGLEGDNHEKRASVGSNHVPTNSKRDLSDDHWFWVAIVLAHLEGKNTPKDILEILPSKYHEGGTHQKWAEWFSKTLCKQDLRWTLQQAWKQYHGQGLKWS